MGAKRTFGARQINHILFADVRSSAPMITYDYMVERWTK